MENDSYTLRMKNYDMMAFGEPNLKDSWIAPDRWEEFSQSKQLWEEGIKLEPWILKRMDQDLRETLLWSSKSENDDEKHHQNYWDTPGEWKSERLSQQRKEFENDLGEGMWLMKSYLRQTSKGFENSSRKLEESGKILEKDLWVRAH